MTRLNIEPAQPSEAHAVLTDPDLTHTAKVVWTYLSIVSDPQRMRPLAKVLGMAQGTVMRSLRALEAKGLAYREDEAWLAERPVRASDRFIVGYGPERLHDITVHNRKDGSAVIETVSTRPVRAFAKHADGSLVELHGEAKDRALEAFWADVDTFNAEQENGS
ncbi:hypothetical protein ACFWXR_14250 [[Kitasatospora] papulosa]|uniref:hypothetical protein n=1 Tax=[Kitasatospora] papulosa TaxID=1464011 RepID=UPI0036CB0A37